MPINKLSITLQVPYRIAFTEDAFALANHELEELMTEGCRYLIFVEQALAEANPELLERITSWQEAHQTHFQGYPTVVVAGGESSKQGLPTWEQAVQSIQAHRIDRHSYIIAIGGGAFMDVIGFAAATAHRGIRLIRLPSTTLSQADSGVGVKNGVNYGDEKNYLGTFAIPWATLNDASILHAQPEGLKRAGLSEIVKVALVKDAEFFDWLEFHAEELDRLERTVLAEAVARSAMLHARHIALGGDPFETGSSRPLDFGHWSAHQLETLSGYRLGHADAVAIGMTLDITYSFRKGWLSRSEAERIVALLHRLQLPTYHPLLAEAQDEVLEGLRKFREHLGGKLTLLMLRSIGMGFDIHELDKDLLRECMTACSIPTTSFLG